MWSGLLYTLELICAPGLWGEVRLWHPAVTRASLSNDIQTDKAFFLKRYKLLKMIYLQPEINSWGRERCGSPSSSWLAACSDLQAVIDRQASEWWLELFSFLPSSRQGLTLDPWLSSTQLFQSRRAQSFTATEGDVLQPATWTVHRPPVWTGCLDTAGERGQSSHE